MDQAMKDRGLTGEAGGRIGRTRGERGYVIPMVGLLLIPLMVVTAFAVDVGTFYAKGTDLQRAVDMAAMAGVVWLPNTSKAQTEAQDTLLKNGYSSSNATITYTQVTENRYRVSATIVAPRFFSSVVTGANQTITRSSTAQYNKPVPLGSPDNKFGNTITGDLDGDGVLDPGECIDPQAACAGSQPQLWAAIQGPYTNNADGDPYATRCLGNRASSSSCSSPPGLNPEFRQDGYLYAIQATAGQTVTVQIYDAPLYSSPPLNYTRDTLQGNGFATDYELFTEDGSALTTNTDASLTMSTGGRCSSGPGRRAFASGYGGNTGASTLHNKWFTLCTFTAPQTGVYPLRVRTSNIPADSHSGSYPVAACTASPCQGGGWNGYSVRATVPSGTQPRIYGIGDMSIWNVANGSTATFYLADVQPIHAGKKMVLDMYDPGDGGCVNNSVTCSFTMEINGPGGSDFACTLNYGQVDGQRGDTSGGGSSYGTQCRFLTRTSGTNSCTSCNQYNSRWVRLQIQIPLTYTCTTDCWWKVNYTFGTNGAPTDRTVWAVQIVGDPVHLTE